MFCSKCGVKIPDDASFCHSCGSAVQVSGKGKHVNRERTVEYAGVVRKCPACGEIIDSFMAKCPSCGHEVKSTEVTNSLLRFTERLSKYSRVIADEQIRYRKEFRESKSWRNWSTTGAALWVFLNLFTFFVPAIIRLICLSYIEKNHKTPPEKEKAAYIENFVFPSDRENLLESLIFVKSKIAFLQSERINDKTLFWSNLWLTKADQLKEKAESLGIYDDVAQQYYESIYEGNLDMIKTLWGRRAILIAVLVLLVLCVVSFGFIRNAFLG